MFVEHTMRYSVTYFIFTTILGGKYCITHTFKIKKLRVENLLEFSQKVY